MGAKHMGGQDGVLLPMRFALMRSALTFHLNFVLFVFCILPKRIGNGVMPPT